MSNFNRIVLVGTVKDAPETRFGAESSTSVSRFNLVVERPARQDGTIETDLVPVVLFGKSADYTAEFVKPHSIIVVEGKIQNRTIDKNGQKNWLTEVIAHSVRTLGNCTGGNATATTAINPGATSAPETIGANPFTENAFTEDDVPF